MYITKQTGSVLFEFVFVDTVFGFLFDTVRCSQLLMELNDYVGLSGITLFALGSPFFRFLCVVLIFFFWGGLHFWSGR